MKKWLFIALVIVGLLAFAAVVWFAGPLIVFGAFAPLEEAWIRLTIIGTVWLLAGLVYLFRWWRRRSSAARLEAELRASAGESDDAKILTERMIEALNTLKASGAQKSNYLYALPWYIIIGPPGAGKTTALLNSGLTFPLKSADEVRSVKDAGGTRYCDWWFTDEAVMVDTAGRYSTQDSDSESDKKSWLSFLSLLKRYRAKQPINGVIVAISLDDVMRLSPDELAKHSNAIRKRLLEVHQQLKIDFPVYALFTKADRIAGFNEYFGNFTESRRRKVWGATFQTENRRKNMIAAVPEEFDALVKRLTEELPDRLQEEPDAISRIQIFGFPAQFAMLKNKVAGFLRDIFEPNRYTINANLRGFYFSSGTQEGTAIDQVLGAMDRNFGGGAVSRMSGLGRSYFLHDLVKNVIFSETGWVSLDIVAVRRSAVFRYGVMTMAGLLTLIALGAWGWSYFNNEQLIDHTEKFVADYRVQAKDLISANSVSDTDLMSVLGALDMLSLSNPVGFERRAENVPIQETFGLSQRDRLLQAAEATYQQALDRMFLSRILLRLEAQLQDTINDPMAAYQALKVYLMLGGQAPKIDADFIAAWMKQDWEVEYAGPQQASARSRLETHLRAMLALDAGHKPAFVLNQLLIDEARKTLTRLTIAEQAYGYLKSLVYSVPVEDFNVAMRSGPESDKVFETVDGTDFTQLTVSALFTYRGFHEFFLEQLSSIAEQLRDEKWVRGDLGSEVTSDEALAKLGPQLLDLYSREFVSTWTRVLQNIKLKRMPGEKPEFLPLQILSNTSSSPLAALTQAVVDETSLTKEPPPPPAGDAVDQATADTQALFTKRLQQQATGLQRIGIDLALKKSLGTPGDAPAALPGANIEAQFKDYAVLADGAPRPIDAVVAQIADVYNTVFFIAKNPSGAQAGGNDLGIKLTALQQSATKMPPDLRRMVSSAVNDLEGDAAGSSLSQLNEALASQVSGLCDKLISNRYPFNPRARDEVAIGDFARIFAPNGAIDSFFQQKLSPLADQSADPWTWKQDTALGRDLSQATLRQFQNAAAIRDAFFPPGAAQPAVALTITQTSLNPAAEGALLNINGATIQTQQQGNSPVPILWPGSVGGGGVTLTLSPEMEGRESTVSVTGPWALLRVIGRNLVSRRGDTLHLTITVGGRDVSYDIQVGTALNPFFLKELSDFACPESL